MWFKPQWLSCLLKALFFGLWGLILKSQNQINRNAECFFIELDTTRSLRLSFVQWYGKNLDKSHQECSKPPEGLVRSIAELNWHTVRSDSKLVLQYNVPCRGHWHTGLRQVFWVKLLVGVNLMCLPGSASLAYFYSALVQICLFRYVK